MSITFNVEGERPDLDRPETYLNVNNMNGAELLRWLGLSGEPYGEVSTSDLEARCRRRLWPEPRNADTGRSAEEPEEHRGRVHIGGRRAGYLPEKAEELVKLCERAKARGAERIRWG